MIRYSVYLPQYVKHSRVLAGLNGEAVIGTRFEDWAAGRAAAEAAGEVELRQRFEAAIELGLQFRDARVAHGMSQRELSEASGVRQADISRIERGAGNPTESTLQRLALALDRRLELV
jgi:XRE family transcriptional regulator, regulator of sulfur utilization